MLVCALPARAALHPPRNCGKLAPRPELSCARRQLAQAKRRPLPHSAAFWAWRERVARGWIRSARYRIAHPPIQHLALWLCIHGGEGNSGTSAAHPNSGPLQMTPYWAGYPVRDWSVLPVYEVYRRAEAQLRIHMVRGDALSWLWTQWWGDHACFYLAGA